MARPREAPRGRPERGNVTLARWVVFARDRRIEQMFGARPTGVRRGHAHSGFKLIPIEGAQEWGVAYRDSA